MPQLSSCFSVHRILFSGMNMQKDMTLRDELPRSVVPNTLTGEEWRNGSRKNEKAEPKQK